MWPLGADSPQKYKVLYVNSADVTVNGKPVKVGDVFDQNAIVRWTKERQAMKVIGLDDHKRYVMVNKPTEQNNISVLDILTHTSHMSTHDNGMGQEASPRDRLEQSIAPHYDLLDSILIPSTLPVNKNCYFLGSYKYGDTRLTKPLRCVSGQIVIDKNLFVVDGEHLEPRDILLTIDYMTEQGLPMFVKDNISLTIIPEWVP